MDFRCARVCPIYIYIHIRVLSGVKFSGGGGGGGTYTSVICMYIHTRVGQRKHDVVYSIILKTTLMHAYQVFFQNNDEDEAMAMYSDVHNGGQIFMWNDSGLS